MKHEASQGLLGLCFLLLKIFLSLYFAAFLSKVLFLLYIGWVRCSVQLDLHVFRWHLQASAYCTYAFSCLVAQIACALYPDGRQADHCDQ